MTNVPDPFPAENHWVGFDLDGTLAHHEEGTYQGGPHIGEPIPAMLALLKHYLRTGMEVRIFTARWERRFHDDSVVPAIEAWCEKHIGQKLRITNIKTNGMRLLYDDRAIGIIRNTGLPKTEEHIHKEHSALLPWTSRVM